MCALNEATSKGEAFSAEIKMEVWPSAGVVQARPANYPSVLSG